jgi:cytochrome d ubiquinol oxidase subunit II
MQRSFGATFAFSSLLTPFFMGTVIGAMATGQIPADASHASLRLGRSPPPARTWRGGVLACQAVREPGVKWTIAASGRREPAGHPRYWARPICCLCTAAS